MKKIVIILNLVLFFGTALQAQDVHYTLTNPRDMNEGGDYFYYVDVLSYSNEGFKLGSGQLYFNYDTTAFGPNVFVNDRLEVLLPDSSVLNQKVGAPPFEFSFYGDIIINDNTYNRFSYSWQHDFSFDCLLEENMNPYSDVLFTLKLKYKEGMENADPGICLEGSAVYVDQTFTACGPDPCNTSDCFNHPGDQLTMDFYTCSECLIVYSTNDAGVGTLREAITCASTGDTIRFAPNLFSDSIVLSSAQLDLNKDLFIIAKKDLGLVVRGELVNRVFDVLQGNEVFLEGISIISGMAQQGSGIRNDGKLSLKNMTIYYDVEVPPGSVIQNLDSIHVVGFNAIIKSN
jgi:hypothetical protein